MSHSSSKHRSIVGITTATFTLLVAMASSVRAAEVHDVAWAGNLAKLRELIDADPTLIAATDDSKQIPLHLAARGGHPAMVQYLLDQGSDFRRHAYNGFTPLHLTSNGDVARMLIKAGADIHARSAFGDVMQGAAEGGRIQVAQALAEAGEPIDFRAAILLGMTDKVQAMLAAKQMPLHPSDCEGPIYLAAKVGHREIVELLLAHGADVDAGCGSTSTGLRWTALTAAVLRHHEGIATLLLESGANPNVSVGQGTVSLLQLAVERKAVALVRLLLDKGAKVNESDEEWEDGGTALHRAAYSGDLELVELLLASGARVNAGKGVLTPLMIAASCRHSGIVQVLQAHGAELDVFTASALGLVDTVGAMLDAEPRLLEARDPAGGRTPLAWAVRHRQADVRDALLSRGAAVNAPAGPASVRVGLSMPPPSGEIRPAQGETPLHIAAQQGDVSTATVLLTHGADVNARLEDVFGGDGVAPLHLAAAYGHLEMAALLLNRGANANCETASGTPLVRAMQYPDIVKLLIAGGAHVDAPAFCGRPALQLTSRDDLASAEVVIRSGGTMDIFSAIALGRSELVIAMLEKDPPLIETRESNKFNASVLQAAVEAGEADLVTSLLERGADPEVMDSRGGSALWSACDQGDLGMVSSLLAHGAQINWSYYQGSPLNAAARSGSVEIGRLLIQHRADVHERSLRWKTPLHVAALWNRAGMVHLLVDAGADVNVDGEGDDGRRPLHTAAGADAVDAVRALLARGADAKALDYRGRAAIDHVREESASWSADPETQERARTARRTIRELLTQAGGG